jgi:type IV secretion system protein VirB6
MDMDAPISWLLAQINQIVSAGANSTASAITGLITPIVAAGFGIYVLLVCMNFMRGGEDQLVTDFIIRRLRDALAKLLADQRQAT